MPDDLSAARPVLADVTAFIETAFPVSRLSLESFKERDAKQNQTLTATGSYWKGRKPLILVRGAVLGCLLPSTGDDPESRRRDLGMFLKLMAMDDDAMLRRWGGALDAVVASEFMNPPERERFLEVSGKGKTAWKRGEAAAKREGATLAFKRMPYHRKLAECSRPEELSDAIGEGWVEINAHYGTHATTMPEFVEQIGFKRFGHRPRVSDRFAGGGSIPFEAARLGCDVEATDLNPVAGMLTWGALNIMGGGEEFLAKLASAQKRVAETMDRRLTELGIERNAVGDRGKAYLYCLETRCPTSGWLIPMTTSFIVNQRKRVVIELVPNDAEKRFDLRCVRGASDMQMQVAEQGTISGTDLIYDIHSVTYRRSLKSIRGDIRGADGASNRLRKWEKHDFIPAPDDIYQERLLCIRWVEHGTGEDIYTVPDGEDLRREREVAEIVGTSLRDWHARGLVSDMEIQPGEKTNEIIRTRGWTYWHHLFHPRQLLMLATMREAILSEDDGDIGAALLLVFNKVLDHSTRLSHWHPSWAKPEQLFYNMAFNTFMNYGVRGFSLLENILSEDYRRPALISTAKSISIASASDVKTISDLYVTDPPYADAIHYHEITEFFIAWNRKHAPRPFADWPWSSRRSLAIQGKGVDFRRQMIDAYRAMADHMPENGMQVVMFTHQDPAVWADLGMILWAAGLRVTAAWCITTEVEKVVTVGNNVQGTVLLVLRKRRTSRNGWAGDVLDEVEDEVKAQLQSMLDLDNEGGTGGIRNFSDADYQLAAYAAALRVITGYATIDKKDVGAEVLRERKRGEKTEIQSLIERAVEVANNYLVPDGVTQSLWSQLGREARFYLKMVEVESRGDRQLSAYAEFARGFGLSDHKRLLGSDKANEARLRWASDWKGRDLGESDFGQSLVRHVLFAVWKIVQTEQTKDAITYLRHEVVDYWRKRQSLAEIARFLAEKRTSGKEKECDAASLLAGALSTDRM